MGSTYKVFVSSTYLDNVERRQRVIQAVLSAEMAPIGMEQFEPAFEKTPEWCIAKVRECDVLVAVIGWRYGSILGNHKRSVTELEIDEAKERLVLLLDESVEVAMTERDRGPGAGEKFERLEALRARLASEHKAATFKDDVDLALKVQRGLTEWARKKRSSEEAAVRTPAVPVVAPPTIAPLDRTLEAQIERYRETIRERCNSIHLLGFEARVRSPLRLEDLYVPLSASLAHSSREDVERAPKSNAPRGHDDSVQLAHVFKEARTRSKKRGVVLLGHPGAGKTTHLKRMRLWAANGTPQTLAELGLTSRCVPVFVPLRDRRSDEFVLERLVDDALAAEPFQCAAGLTRKLLDSGRLLLLIDGLDEVADPDARTAAARMIADALRDHPSLQLAVTCRFAGFNDDLDAQLRDCCIVFELQPLSRDNADLFIERWFEVVEPSLDPEHLADALKLARQRSGALIAKLREPDFRQARVVEMARNPMLLTAICLVHRDGGGLPEKRAELLEKCVNVLLELWRKHEKELAVTVPASKARLVLEPMAHFLHEVELRTSATIDELQPVLDTPLRRAGWKGVGAADFLRTIENESGLITGHGSDKFGFLHLAFQEYLTAREIRNRACVDKSVFTQLARRWGDTWWREVILLLLALEETWVFDAFMAEVTRRPQFYAHGELLDACLADAFHKSPAPFLALLEPTKSSDESLFVARVEAVRLLSKFDSSALRDPRVLAVTSRDGRFGELLQHQRSVRSGELKLGNGLVLAPIPAGKFLMGSQDGIGDPDEHPQHEVELSAFFLSPTPITNEQYARFLEANPGRAEPLYWSDSRYNQPQQPVVGVDWDDAKAFCDWAGVALPTEAQWEYACRAGTTTRYWSGDTPEDLERVGWFSGNSGGRLHPVAEKPPNAFGLFDMHGNVWEWCADGRRAYTRERQKDPVGPAGAGGRVIRGGAFWFDAARCRSAYRDSFLPGVRGDFLGFRVAFPGAPQPGGASTLDP